MEDIVKEVVNENEVDVQNENMYRRIKLSMPHHVPAVFKEKTMGMLVNGIKGARLSTYAKVYKYANITFDDDRNFYMNVELMDSFKRGKTNGLVLDVVKQNKFYDGSYDKVIIYAQEFKNSAFFAFVLYNTETKKSNHIYGFDRNDGLLISKIYELLTNIYRKNIIRLYTRYMHNGVPADKLVKLKDIYHNVWEKAPSKIPFDHSIWDFIDE